jgi:cell division protein FtsN
MNLIYTLVGIIVALAGAFFFQKGKKDSAEALLQNQDMKNKLNPLDQQIAKNNGLLEAEEVKRQQMAEELKRKENEKLSDEELLKRLNNK